LEAQRLGLRALSGDLNPVAVLINKAMIEIPPRFAGRPPVHPELRSELAGTAGWERAQGLAADVQAYGAWMRDEAQRRIGPLYPDATGPNGEQLTPIAWIWARTVKSPDPAWKGHVPLVASWHLAKRKNKPAVWIEPIVDYDAQTISYEVRTSGEPTRERTVGRGGGRCIATGASMPFGYIRSEFQAGRSRQELLAVVAEGQRGRTYLAPTADQEKAAKESSDFPKHTVSGQIFDWPGRTNVVRYGMDQWEDLFTQRQLVALTTFSDLLGEVRQMAESHARAAAALDVGASGAGRFAAGASGADSGGESAAAHEPPLASGQADMTGRVAAGSLGACMDTAATAGGRLRAGSPDASGRATQDAVSAAGSADDESSRQGAQGTFGGAVRAEAQAATALDGLRLRDGGSGAAAYADAVVTHLAFAVDRCADYWSSICTWNNGRELIRSTFARQAIPMTWDFAEANPFSSSTGNWMAMVDWVRKAVEHLPAQQPSPRAGTASPHRGAEGVQIASWQAGAVVQRDARARVRECAGAAIATDPPYYDNISYADLSDFFFVWLRRSLSGVWPDECATLLTPKAEEMIANRYRAGSREAAEKHFEEGMAGFMAEVAEHSSSDVPATVFYAYKATETDDDGVRATGWDTFLQGVVDAGLQVTATWPLRTELANRPIAMGANALASSIVLACRPRPETASLASRTRFLEALRAELPEAIRKLQSGSIAPVDMAQSAIGPGIAVFSRYAKVIEADGRTMPVADALAAINDVLGEILDGEEAELDNDSRFAVAWYAQHGYEAASSGDADNLARAKNTALAGIEQSGIGEARAGRFRLYRRDELPEGWDPARDDRITVWEATQHLTAALYRSELQAAALLRQLGGYGDNARQLAYVLYAKAEANGWAEEAAAYNTLIAVWTDLRTMPPPDEQLFGSS